MSSRMSTRQLIDDRLLGDRLPGLVERLRQVAEIHERVKVFEAIVWFPRLQEMINASEYRGMSGTCQGVKIMTWCCAGRCLIQLQTDKASLTLITVDDEKPWSRDNAHVAPNMGPMGIQGIDAEWLDALKMLYTVTRYADEIELTPDDSVSIGI